MTDTLKARIQQDTKAAMKAKDKTKLSELRSLSAAIKQQEIDEQVELDDQGVLGVIQKLIKQHQESLAHYQQAERDELMEKEQNALALLKSYLPEPLSQAELDALIDETIKAEQAQSIKAMGAVMKALKPKIQGRADMSQVSQRVKARLSG